MSGIIMEQEGVRFLELLHSQQYRMTQLLVGINNNTKLPNTDINGVYYCDSIDASDDDCNDPLDASVSCVSF